LLRWGSPSSSPSRSPKGRRARGNQQGEGTGYDNLKYFNHLATILVTNDKIIESILFQLLEKLGNKKGERIFYSQLF